jgi:hypothetical protein
MPNGKRHVPCERWIASRKSDPVSSSQWTDNLACGELVCAFGLVRLEQLLSQHAAQPLSQIWELVMGKVKQHGIQQDDQSLLLLRVRE